MSAEDDAYTPASLTPDERAALCEQHASPWRAPSALANARIVFASWCDTDSALFVVAADGTGLTRLTPADSWSADPAATRDGREVVFSTAAGGSSLDLAAIDVRFLETTLLRTGGGADEAPALSPDGRRLAFVKRSGCELLLLFPRDPCETARLMVSSSRGEAAVTVYRLPTGDATRPAWSPQGDLIAFSADTGDGFHDLFVIRPDGRGLHALTTTPERDEREPAWSPNGRWIAFGCGDDVDDRRAVCVMPSAGGEARRLTPGDGSFAPSPAWSPDGEWIAYSAVTGDDEDVWLMRSDGQQPRLVARTAGLDERPAWLPG